MKNTVHILIGFCLIFLPINLTAQELKRKGSLGIRMQPMSDSIAVLYNIEKGKGLYILKAVPNSTVGNLGMKNGAVLLKINDQETNSLNDLFAITNNVYENDQISISYFQNGKSTTMKGVVKGRPKEKSEIADVYYGQVDFDGNHLRSILYTPKNSRNPPVVYFLQGYTCQSTEFSRSPNFSIMKLINDWVKAGYAVYRVEKANVGDSDCDIDCSEMNFNQELEGFRQGYISLQKNKKIDPNNIFLFGHSMGGVVAPILAKEFNPKGVITYGTVVNSWFEYMQELTRVQGEVFNSPFNEIERDLRNSLPFWYELMVEQKSNADILENEKIKSQLESEGILELFENGQFMDRHYTYWATLNQVNLVDTWLNVESNVLAIYGEFDIQALNANHVKTIAKIVNATHPGKGQYDIIPNADHGFVYFDSLEDNVNALTNGQYMQQLINHYHPGIAKSTITWMNTHI